jgi:hypothetical protein
VRLLVENDGNDAASVAEAALIMRNAVFAAR